MAKAATNFQNDAVIGRFLNNVEAKTCCYVFETGNVWNDWKYFFSLLKLLQQIINVQFLETNFYQNFNTNFANSSNLFSTKQTMQTMQFQ